jgi:hypothetical protein
MKDDEKNFYIHCCVLFSISAVAQDYSFSITIVGEGGQALKFIPGFACFGDVWNETVDELKSDYTCYVLTMPRFAGVQYIHKYILSLCTSRAQYCLIRIGLNFLRKIHIQISLELCVMSINTYCGY